MKFSVLMSVYKNEDVDHFEEAVNSILKQTILPDEIILIRDGIVYPELQNKIDEYIYGKHREIFSYYPLKENQGLGNALKIGVEKAKYDYIARMDTDDIAIPNRFELQIKFMKEHSEISVCGGQILEFKEKIENIIGKRNVPILHDNIRDFLKKRNPMNHMTVMFKKKDVIETGNYLEIHYMEDYYLWCRMILKGYRFANLPETLVYARVDDKTYQRRGGYRYFQSWKYMEKFKLENKIISKVDYNIALFMKFIVQVITPSKARELIFKKFLRSQ